MADWCGIPIIDDTNVKKKTNSVKADNGFWCSANFKGNVVVDYAGVSSESGSATGTVTGSSGIFTFTPPAGLPYFTFRLFGGAGGGASGGWGEDNGFTGRDGTGGYGGLIGQAIPATTIYPPSGPSFTGSETFAISLGLGGLGGPGTYDGGFSCSNGFPGVSSTFDIYTALGGTGGDNVCGYGDDQCNEDTQGKDGDDSSQGTGGAGGSCQGDSHIGNNGSQGGISAGGGGGGGGGGSMLPYADDNEAGGDGGTGGAGRIIIDWDISVGPTTNDTWC